MEVVTFYSYKGGVGRTLMLAWVARALAARGKRVLALDLDLEAPGLPSKLRPVTEPRAGFGLVDLLLRFQGGASPPTDLVQWCLPVATHEGNLWLLPAGAAPLPAYWQALGKVSWETLFVERAADGARFFLWLRDALAMALEPDFLLIDARTGVTEMGAAAVGMLADAVVAVTNMSLESKTGLREVLRAAVGSPRAEGRVPLRVLSVLSRIPALLGADSVSRFVDDFRGFLNEEADPLSYTLTARDVVAVRHEEVLLKDEQRALAGPSLGVNADYARVLEWILGHGTTKSAGYSLVHRPSQAMAAIRAEQDLIDSIRERASQDSNFQLPMLAEALMSLAGNFAGAGRREQALSVTEQAVAIYRRLAKEQPGVFLPELAGSLNNLGNRSVELGRREEALSSLTESLSIFRRLVGQDATLYSADLAICLANLGNVQGELGKREEALVSAAESVDIHRNLARQQPDIFLPDLATSLSNFGVSLRAAGRSEEALASVLESADKLRGLIEQGRGDLSSELAITLNNLALIQNELGRPTEAIIAASEAVSVFRTLVERQPELFRSRLAASLQNLGNNLSAIGRTQEALTSLSESVEIYTALVEQWPDAFVADFAKGLSDLGLRQLEAGNPEGALISATRTLEVRRRLAEASPMAFASDVVVSLHNLAKIQSELALGEAALSSSEEAVELSLKLVAREPRAFKRQFDAVLDGYRCHLEALGRDPQADALMHRAAALRVGDGGRDVQVEIDR